MCGSLVRVLAGLVAIIGIAGSAHASATLDLIWPNSGTSVTSLAVSSNVTLNVVLTAGPMGLRAAAITLDYADALGSLSVVGITNDPSMQSPSAILPLVLGDTVDTGSRVLNLTAEVFPPFVRTGLMSGQSWLLGTVTLVATSTAGGTFSISSRTTGTDEILDISGVSISGGTKFNSAMVSIVPEPESVALFGLGLLGLAFVGRRGS
ncbi:MAG: PEP-CTERM sorting domain-containing protein [Myxococcota bacterium]